jgi:serine/threonine-protein kinase RsbW
MSSDSSDDREWQDLLDFFMPADAKAIAEATDAISETLTRLEVPEEKRLEVALAVQEALANAVVHGCENNPSKQVRCQLQCDSQGGILVTITDPGPGFNPLSLTDPRQPGKLYAEHGRGVSLIRQLMDEVHFQRASAGNQIMMRKY